MDSNKQLLKSLTQGKTAAKQSSFQIPGLESLRKVLKNTKSKQVIDLAIFSVGIYLMFKFGKTVAETIDNQMPTEKSMMDMMKSMQGPGMMPPGPM